MTLVITNGTLIDGRGRDPFVGSLVIEGGRIAALGQGNRVTIPREATVIDAMGGSILPGLIDCHVHFLLEYPDILRGLFTPPSLSLLQAIPRMRATLEAGVTTVRDAAGAPAGLKMAVERGIVAGPRMQVAVSLISQTGGVLSPSDTPTASQLTVEEIATAVDEAAAQEKRCMAHAQGSQGIKNALLGGVASIEHGMYLTDELIDLMLEQEVYLVPTLVAPLAVLEFAQAHPDLLSPMVAAKATGVIEAHKQSFRRAVEAGVKIAMGTDSGVGKHGENARELLLMAENGMTPMQAIVASTATAAQLLHLEHQVGTLEVGKLADIVVVDGDVLEDISKIADPVSVKLVLKGGQAAKNTLV